MNRERELPQIGASLGYSATTHTGVGIGAVGVAAQPAALANQFVNQTGDRLWHQQLNQHIIGHHQGPEVVLPRPASIRVQMPKEEELPMSTRRLVQIFIADPDVSVPTGDALLYRGEQIVTDATDQELFYEIDLRAILAKHNEARVKLPNKTVKERREHLEPARIRDLRMTVVTIATF